MVDLGTILNWLDIKSEDLGIDISNMCLDSRKTKAGDLFIALCGNDNHGIDFAYQVQRAGAKAILAESITKDCAKPKSRQQPLTIPVIEIEGLSGKLGSLADKFYQSPSKKLKVVGITGTNGKTSSAWLLLQAWEKLGVKAGYIGTLGYGTLQQIHDQPNTTPSALVLQKILAQFVNQGITHVSLEVSSHGLQLGRVNSINFDGVAFTNLSRDHLDFHGTMENYSAIKKSLFTDYKANYCVLNFNDRVTQQWIPTIKTDICGYAIDAEGTDLNVTDINLKPSGIEFNLTIDGASHLVNSQLLGRFNIHNLLIVIATLLNQDFKLPTILDIIPELKPVPGRMNLVESDKLNPLVIVDYAHTPDALKQVLMALRQHNARKIWCVFGCGGNRDKGKRPQMGHIAETLADNVILTDDNPRYEDSKQIIDDILMGMTTNPLVINSRKEAITHAINHADCKDLILIAGKGHENYQLVNGQYFTFDDQHQASLALENNKVKCA